MVKSFQKALLISGITACVVSSSNHNTQFVEGKLRGSAVTTTIDNNENENGYVGRKLDEIGDIDFDIDVPDIGDRRELHYNNYDYDYNYGGGYYNKNDGHYYDNRNRHYPGRRNNRNRNRYNTPSWRGYDENYNNKYNRNNRYKRWDDPNRLEDYLHQYGFRLWSSNDGNQYIIDEQGFIVDNLKDSVSSSKKADTKIVMGDGKTTKNAVFDNKEEEYAGDVEIPVDMIQQKKQDVLDEKESMDEQDEDKDEKSMDEEDEDEDEKSMDEEDEDEIIELTDHEGRRLWGKIGRRVGGRGRGRGRRGWGRGMRRGWGHGWRALTEEDYADLEIFDKEEDENDTNRMEKEDNEEEFENNEELDGTTRHLTWGRRRWGRPGRRRRWGGRGWRRGLDENVEKDVKMDLEDAKKNVKKNDFIHRTLWSLSDLFSSDKKNKNHTSSKDKQHHHTKKSEDTTEDIISKDLDEKEDELLGGKKDEHGCYTSAGYSWNPKKEKCTRSWEDDLEDTHVVVNDKAVEVNAPGETKVQEDGTGNVVVENKDSGASVHIKNDNSGDIKFPGGHINYGGKTESERKSSTDKLDD